MLLLFTYIKSYTSFPLVPKVVTLNDLEQGNDSYLRYSIEFGSVGAKSVKLIENRPNRLQQKCSPRNLVFGNV